MKQQYCRVGKMTPITQGSHAANTLEYRYQNFLEKAATGIDAKLSDFFESKIKSLKKVLEELS